jgi:arylsulfatase A-like enzyme
MTRRKYTRREALKTMAVGAAGGVLLPKVILPEDKHKISFPNIISRRSDKKPNFLVILAEGTPLDAISCYGSHRMHTPNIDRLAKEGMKLENAFVTNALCSPSRATMLTGAYSNVNGMLGNAGDPSHGQYENLFNGTQPTIANVLKEHGYSTGIAGKWHLGSAPEGFDYWKVTYSPGAPYYDHAWYEKPEGKEKDNPENKFGVRRVHKEYATDLTTGMAINFMKNNKEPFCFILAPIAVHSNFEPPKKYQDLYENERFLEPGTFWDDYKNRSAAAKEAHMRLEDMADFQFYDHIPEERPKTLTEKQKKQWNYQVFIRNFAATLKSLDDNIGRVLNYLDESGLNENTIVIYTSDHGFFLGEHGWFDKRFMYEEAIRVPWMIRYPGEIKPGSVSNALGLNIDNAPTILDLAGIPAPKEMQGVSLKPIFEEKIPGDWQTTMYYHYYEWGPPHWVAPHYGIRTDRYTLINYYTINEWELFDRKFDPDEMDNLFKMGGYKIDQNYKDVVPGLVDQLKNLRSKYKDTTGEPVKMWPMKSYD